MDALECGRQGVLAQQAGALDQAAILFTHGIQLTPPSRPNLAAELLRDRADCYWDLQRKEEACMDMKRALELFPGVKVTASVLAFTYLLYLQGLRYTFIYRSKVSVRSCNR